ncbi:unnamed protein product [Miscanthus lutarioriparius]|uniref:Uncharacterized protein n=1 Tax=Miscanthus lutarioriparius TaxID=422564 RepID=A0A811R3Q3_9POAL|nr:unnamed protein product [Miscanthus lutarioriparius]
MASGGKARPSAIPNVGTDFELLLGRCAAACSMLPIDDLFSRGKLVPLRIPTPKDEMGALGVVKVEVEVTAQSMLLPKQEEPLVPAQQ